MHRHGRINRIAALAQHLHPNGRGQGMGADHGGAIEQISGNWPGLGCSAAPSGSTAEKSNGESDQDQRGKGETYAHSEESTNANVCPAAARAR